MTLPNPRDFASQVYDTSDGTLIQPLKGHKDTVYCVAYAKDGDCHTITIWAIAEMAAKAHLNVLSP